MLRHVFFGLPNAVSTTMAVLFPKARILLYATCLAVTLSVLYTIFIVVNHRSCNTSCAERYEKSTAVITGKLPGKISRTGHKPTRYEISFTTRDHQRVNAANVELGDELNVGDSIVIYYRADDPKGTVSLFNY